MAIIGPRISETVEIEEDEAAYTISYRDGTTFFPAPEKFNFSHAVNHFEDFKNEDYFDLKARGKILPTLVMNSNDTVTTLLPTSVNYIYDKYRWTLTDGERIFAKLFPLIDVSGPDSQSLNDIKAITINAVKAKVSSAEMLSIATLKELGSTKNMIINGCKSIGKFAKAATKIKKCLDDARRHRLRAKSAYMKAENIWMEMRMGWRPFIGEIENLIKATTDVEYPERKTVISSSVWCGSDARDVVFLAALPFRLHLKQQVLRSVTVKCGILLEKKVGGKRDTWGLRSLPETLWELTPLSWAIDYFCNIGDSIAAMTPDSYWEPKDSWMTVTHELEQITKVKSSENRYPQYYPTATASGGHKKVVTRSVSRAPFSLNNLYGPRIVTDFNWKKTLDTLAVTRQQSSKALRAISRFRPRRR